MRYPRIFADDQGETHFDDVDTQFQQREVVPGKPPIDVSQAMAADNVVFIQAPAGLAIDYHPAPSRHLLVVISGGWKMTVSDGESRQFGPGDAILVEDLVGKGHLTEVTGHDDFLGFFAWLDDKD